MKLRYQPSTRFRPFVQKMLKCGHWEPTNTQVDNGAHSLLRHKATGKTVAYGLHDGGNEWNGPRNMAKNAGDICGCVFIENRNRRRSRKKDQVSGFDIDLAVKEQQGWHTKWGGTAEELHARHALKKSELAWLVARGDRTAAAKARDVLAELTAIENHLTAMHQPYEPFQLAQ